MAKPLPDIIIPLTQISGSISLEWYQYFQGRERAIPATSGPYLVAANNLSDLASAATARGNLGLSGTLVTVSGHALALGGSVALSSADVSGLGYFATGTSAANLTGTLGGAQFPALTGDVTTVAGALATTLAVSGVTAATYGSTSQVPQIAVDAKGRITSASNVTVTASAIVRGHLHGLAASTAGSSSTFSVALGQTTSSDFTTSMVLAASISKTTGAWAVGTGNGALDTGAIANSTWYHVYLIERVDTGVVDVLISLSASAPTMPTNYTVKRRIWSLLTNGSAQWQSFTQLGDLCLWGPPYLDINGVTLTTVSRTLYTLTVPLGVNVQALGRAQVNGTSVQCIITSPSENDTIFFTAGTGGLSLRTTAAADTAAGEFETTTNLSAQIAVRGNGTTPTFSWSTLGYIDRRGKDA